MSKIKGKSIKLSSPFDATSSKTERTCVAKIAEWINRIIDDKALPMGKAEVETRGSDDKYPDIVLYESPQTTDVLLVAEFKRPYYDPYDETELKDPARRKATKRNAKYFATSNFQKLIWYNTERVNKMVREEDQIVEEFILSELYDLDAIDEPQFKNPIIKSLEAFLDELVKVHTGRKPEPLKPIDEHLVFRLHDKVHRLSRFYKPIIRDRVHKDVKFSKDLKKWFREQQWSFAPGDESAYEKVARQTAYLLVNKILFYDVLKARNPDIPTLTIPEDLTKGGFLKGHLQNYFNYVLNEIDYETVYSTDFIDDIAFPDSREIVKEIKDLVGALSQYRFAEIDFDIIGRIFEMLIPPDERHDLGQYFTSADIVDLILRFCIQHERDMVLDPSCGAGTFLVRAYKHKRLMNQRLSHNEILKDLWGFDIAKFPSHLSTINLALRDLSVRENYPQIIKEDFFAFRHRAGFEESKRKKEIVSPDKKTILISYPTTVDCIVGNPPYTRQEEIKEISKEAGYKEDLIESALYDGNRKIANISKRAGIHTYFFVHGTKFLKDGGRFGYIVSNSWLDVDYGKGLQEFFLLNYKIIAVIESKVERWFEAADVNTCIVILEKCKVEKERDENLVRFVYLFKPLRNFIPAASKTWEEERIRLNAIEDLIKTILYLNDFYQTDDYRIYPKRQSELWEEGFDAEEDKYTGSKWGKYLRAPEIFFKILKKGKDKLVPLKEIADVKRGFTTGADPWFYVRDITDTIDSKEMEEITGRKLEKGLRLIESGDGTRWVVDDKYLKPVICNPDELSKIRISEEEIENKVIVINEPKEALKGEHVLKYIKHGEVRAYNMGKNRSMIPARTDTCSSRTNWYQLPAIPPSRILWQKAIDRYHRHYLCDSTILANQRFYPIYPKSGEDAVILAAFLNTSFISLYLEFQRAAMGLGAIEATVAEVKQLPVILPKIVSKKNFAKIATVFEQISNRDVKSIFEEMQQVDRQNLDSLFLESIGFSDLKERENTLQELYTALNDLAEYRFKKAKSVDKKRKTKEGVDVELLTRTIKEKLGDKLLGNFYREKILNQKNLKTVKLFHPKKEIQVRKDFLGGSGWLLVSGKDHIECQTEAEAEYLKLWLESGVDEIKIPKDEAYVSKILPELKALKEKIDRIISDHISSITSQKLQQKILQKLQGELF